MERTVAKRFTPDMLADVCNRFAIVPESVRLISTSESFVYACHTKARSGVLRITPESHRNSDLIAGELAWMGFLADGGVYVARPIPSVDGRRIERVGSDTRFLAVLFERAPGREVGLTDWTEPFFTEWGRVVGRMHRLAKHYRTANAAYERPNWDEEYNIIAVDRVCADDREICNTQRGILRELHALPRDTDCYGLIHSDFEDENFFIDGGKITAFDFDECQYHWFAYDVAGIVRQVAGQASATGQPREDYVVRFLDAFWSGYETENHLDHAWLQRLPLFLRLRDVCMYVYLQGKRDRASFTEVEHTGIERMRQRIVQGDPGVKLLL